MFRWLLVLMLFLAAPALAQDASADPAFEQLRAAVAAGDPLATEMLADAYAQGKGAPRDLSLAIDNYGLALERGRNWVPYKLALALYQRGGPGDMGRAYGVLAQHADAFRAQYAGEPLTFVNYLMLMSNSAFAAERYGDALAADREALSLVAAHGGPGHGGSAQIAATWPTA